MIFVTVGTHEQPFDRLVRCMDELKGEGTIREDVIIQTGYSRWIPKNCTWRQWMSYQEIDGYMEQARIIVTHGGPSSFLMPLKMGKVPVVMPRKKEYGEHINNHQAEFVRGLNTKSSCIIVVEEAEELREVLNHYEQYRSVCQKGPEENNAGFNRRFTCLVEQLMCPAGKKQGFGV